MIVVAESAFSARFGAFLVEIVEPLLTLTMDATTALARAMNDRYPPIEQYGAGTDARSDLYALGVTAYQTFTGQFPWGKYENPHAQMTAYHSPGADPREHVPDLPDVAVHFLLKAIEREPGKRFQTATAFRDAVLKLPRI